MPTERCSARNDADIPTADAIVAASDLRRIVDSASVLLWVSGLNGQRRWIGHALSTFTGRSQQEVLGQRWVDAVHPEDAERCREIDLACLLFDRKFTLDYRLKCRDGRYVWMMDSATPCHDAAGQFEGHVGVCVDVDERRQVADGLAQRLQAIRRSRGT